MGESMFFVQRYWGSDDEDGLELSSDLCKSKLTGSYQEHIYEPTVKKVKLNASKDLTQIIGNSNGSDEIEKSNLDSISNCNSNDESVKKDKKRKLKKTKSYQEKSAFELTELQNVPKNIEIAVPSENFVSQKRKKNKKKVEEAKNNSQYEEISVQEESILNTSENDNKSFGTIGQVKHPSHVKVKRTLPKWLSSPTIMRVDLHEQETSLAELNYLDANSKKKLSELGINFLFPVQVCVIPWLLKNNMKNLTIRPSDLCVSAPTGSGKTLAFVIPIVQSLKDRVVCAIRAVVVLPVAELAIQVYKVFDKFIKDTDLKVALLTGKKSFLAEQSVLVKPGIRQHHSLADIIVTTPGRILDHIHKTNGFCLRRLRYLVIDEADRMMEEIQQGWLKQIEDAVFDSNHNATCFCFSFRNAQISFEPSSACSFGFISQPLQKLLYSATLSHDPEKLHSLSLYRPKLFTSLSVSETEEEWIGKCPIPDSLKVLQTVCDSEVKPMVVCHLIKEHGFNKVMCFTGTVDRAQRLHLVLKEMGFMVVREISSYNRPVQRRIVLKQFRTGKVNVLVCSDLVARGIDIEDIDCVISYDVPQSVKTYIHRIGRTARAGKCGTAICLLSKDEVPYFRKMLQLAGMKVPEKLDFNPKDLQQYVNVFRKALVAAEEKIRKQKKSIYKQSTSTKVKQKHERSAVHLNNSKQLGNTETS